MKRYFKFIVLILLPAFLMTSCYATRMTDPEIVQGQLERTKTRNVPGERKIVMIPVSSTSVKIVERADTLEERTDIYQKVEKTTKWTASDSMPFFSVTNSIISFGIGFLVWGITGLSEADLAVMDCPRSSKATFPVMRYSCKRETNSTVVGQIEKKSTSLLRSDDTPVTYGNVQVKSEQTDILAPLNSQGMAAVDLRSFPELAGKRKKTALLFSYRGQELSTSISRQQIRNTFRPGGSAADDADDARYRRIDSALSELQDYVARYGHAQTISKDRDFGGRSLNEWHTYNFKFDAEGCLIEWDDVSSLDRKYGNRDHKKLDLNDINLSKLNNVKEWNIIDELLNVTGEKFISGAKYLYFVGNTGITFSNQTAAEDALEQFRNAASLCQSN